MGPLQQKDEQCAAFPTCSSRLYSSALVSLRMGVCVSLARVVEAHCPSMAVSHETTISLPKRMGTDHVQQVGSDLNPFATL